MAYIDRENKRHSAATIVAVTALEAAAIFAIAHGLTVTWRDQPPPPRIVGDQIPLDPPSPLPSPPAEKHDPVIQMERVTPPQPLPSFGTGPIIIQDFGPAVLPSQDASEFIPIPRPQPSPSFTPRLARPRNNPGTWATSNDYPARDLREGNQGVVRFRLEVSAAGRVESCEVTMSSGFAGLDAATCDNVSRRARFEPATDGNGGKIGGAYSGTIRWVIPD